MPSRVFEHPERVVFGELREGDRCLDTVGWWSVEVIAVIPQKLKLNKQQEIIDALGLGDALPSTLPRDRFLAILLFGHSCVNPLALRES